MTKSNKVVAVVLALLMIFSSMSAVAYAFDPETEGGNSLSITAEIYKDVDGTLTAVDKVKAGDDVKVRVSMDTDYYSSSSKLLFFYDNSFFSDSYGSGINTLSVNDTDFEDSTFYTSASTSKMVGRLVSLGVIDQDFADSHNYFAVSLLGPVDVFMYDDTDWLFEFDLKVKSDATGTGAFLINDDTILSPENQNGFITVPKGDEGDTEDDVYDMWFWNVNWVDGSCYDEVTINSSITLDPNGGTWADDSTAPKTFDGTTLGEFTAPAVSYEGKTLMGWYPADTVNATEADCVFGPAGPTAFDEFEDLDLVAFWKDKVAISFDLNYDGAPTPESISVTPGEDFTVSAGTTREGFEFRGWSADRTASPQATDLIAAESTITVPETGTVYYAIWAKEVTISFEDGLTGDAIGTPITGYAGDAITAAIPAPSAHDGYYLMAGNYSPAVPAVFPADNAVYTAVYEPNTYGVKYVIYYNGSVVDELTYLVEFGSVIPTAPSALYKAPAGKTLNGWYTDTALSNAFTAGTLLATTDPVVLYGYLSDDTYEITFDPNGGAFETIANDGDNFVETAAYLGDIALPTETPAKDGFVFKGWTPEVGMLLVPQDMTFTATWEAETFTLTYKVGDSDYQVYPTLCGEKIDIPADAYVDGKTFIGWNTDPDALSGLDLKNVVMPADDLTYYAIFSDEAYTISFYADADADPISSYDAAFGADITYPENNPEKEGYTFTGWSWSYVDDEGTTQAITGEPTTVNVAYDMNAVAEFEINSYDVTFDPDPAVDGDETVTPYNYGAKITAPADPEKEGYTFIGWYDKDDNEVDFDLDVKVGADDVTYTAKYTVNTYNATFDPDPTVDDDETVVPTEYGKNIVAPADPSKTGYTFDGWYDKDNNKVDFTADVPMGAGDATYTAKFTINTYSYTFVVDGEELTDKESFRYGADTTALESAKPTKTGYTFHGWYTDSAYAAGSEYTFSTMPANDVTLYGYFTRDAVDVRFFVDYADGNGFVQVGETAAIDIGQAINVPTITPKEGYVFSGWYVGNTFAAGTEFTDGTLATDPVDIYAKYTIGEYTVTFLAPVRVTATTNYGYLDYDNCTTVSSTTDEFGAAVTAPTAPAIDNYSFVGWTSDSCTGAVAGEASDNIVTPGATIPENGATYYAVYERELVYLVSRDTTKYSIDRLGNDPGTWGDFFTTTSFNLSEYTSASKYGLWFVHVAPGFRVSGSRNPYITTYYDVHGDGTMAVIKGAGGYGTGAMITVTDNVTGEIVEEFYVVIYGDINGDALFNASDVSDAYDAYVGSSWTKKGSYDHCKIMAANLSAPTRLTINASDYVIVFDAYAVKCDINPLTGEATY